MLKASAGASPTVWRASPGIPSLAEEMADEELARGRGGAQGEASSPPSRRRAREAEGRRGPGRQHHPAGGGAAPQPAAARSLPRRSPCWRKTSASSSSPRTASGRLAEAPLRRRLPAPKPDDRVYKVQYAEPGVPTPKTEMIDFPQFTAEVPEEVQPPRGPGLGLRSRLQEARRHLRGAARRLPGQAAQRAPAHPPAPGVPEHAAPGPGRCRRRRRRGGSRSSFSPSRTPSSRPTSAATSTREGRGSHGRTLPAGLERMSDYYFREILGVPADATREQIRAGLPAARHGEPSRPVPRGEEGAAGARHDALTEAYCALMSARRAPRRKPLPPTPRPNAGRARDAALRPEVPSVAVAQPSRGSRLRLLQAGLHQLLPCHPRDRGVNRKIAAGRTLRSTPPLQHRGVFRHEPRVPARGARLFHPGRRGLRRERLDGGFAVKLRRIEGFTAIYRRISDETLRLRLSS